MQWDFKINLNQQELWKPYKQNLNPEEMIFCII